MASTTNHRLAACFGACLGLMHSPAGALYQWTEPDGRRHISTVPRSCLQGSWIKPECIPKAPPAKARVSGAKEKANRCVKHLKADEQGEWLDIRGIAAPRTKAVYVQLWAGGELRDVAGTDVMPGGGFEVTMKAPTGRNPYLQVVCELR